MAKVQRHPRLLNNTHPMVYEVNARILIAELSARAGSPVTLATIPDTMIDEWAELGFDAVWLMGLWSTGSIGTDQARSIPALQEEYRRCLPDLTPDDIASSPFAVQAYVVAPALGGNKALRTLRKRLAERGLGLLLDFVCNHTARDHEWVFEHPEFYVAGSEGDERAKPDMYFKTPAGKKDVVLAFGRDPMFPGWTDTAQLNHAHAGMRRELIATLKSIAGMCDGVRCDMAMLALTEVFRKTWGEQANIAEGLAATDEFWREAITTVRKFHPEFLFIAEAYWGLEWELQQLGFDYTYDKVFYDRLLREGVGSVLEHLRASMEFQRHCLRFVENHDEQRAARAFSSGGWHFASATIMATVPGMALFQEGQLDGRVVKIPVQLVRRPEEPVSAHTRLFYQGLLVAANDQVFHHGKWQLLAPRAAWHENATWQNFLSFWWKAETGSARLVVVNYAPHSGQCYVDLPLAGLEGSPIEFHDVMSDVVYVRDRTGLAAKGLYFDLPGYGIHIFKVEAPSPRPAAK